MLSPAMIGSTIQWSLDDQITEATRSEPALPGGPEGRTYVPSTLRLTFLDIHLRALDTQEVSKPSHSSKIATGGPTWPGKSPNLCCSVFVISKTPRHLPQGKRFPLPILRRPWSHLGVDFVTDLPPSNSHTCILVVVDRFSKACKLIPLKGLTTAYKTAERLFQHVF